MLPTCAFVNLQHLSATLNGSRGSYWELKLPCVDVVHGLLASLQTLLNFDPDFPQQYPTVAGKTS